MPYSPEHRQRSRNKLLAGAFELFAHRGYDAVTIDNVAEHAGLTRGAFYNHFSSKQELYREAMKYAAMNSQLLHQLEAGPHDINTLVGLIDGYLSQEHLTHTQPCPLAFLVTDMANREPQVRDTYTRIFEGITQKLMELIGNGKDRRQRREEAQAIATLLIGGVAVSRALSDTRLTHQVMEACRALAVEVVSTD